MKCEYLRRVLGGSKNSTLSTFRKVTRNLIAKIQVVNRRFESEDDPLFLKLKALNGERSRLAQSFEYNYGDFIPILRLFLKGYLKLCKEVKEKRLQLFKDYFVLLVAFIVLAVSSCPLNTPKFPFSNTHKHSLIHQLIPIFNF
ncbi:hypothetical protein QVD17_26345 [Tagetes erecta]|uniref:Uncharacterized protein n=1 Tax=Tagetes erecta TaxID=13708 RepID=A0AAD8KCP5_TARER|nr:hypothetical protein QVD17_26345 [Tagetes erecta]